MAELLEHGKRTGLSLAQMLRANELCHCSEAELDAGLDKIWSVMNSCIERGLKITGELPVVCTYNAVPQNSGCLPMRPTITCRMMACTKSVCMRWRLMKRMRLVVVSSPRRPMVRLVLFPPSSNTIRKTAIPAIRSKVFVIFCWWRRPLACCVRKMPRSLVRKLVAKVKLVVLRDGSGWFDGSTWWHQ